MADLIKHDENGYKLVPNAQDIELIPAKSDKAGQTVS